MHSELKRKNILENKSFSFFVFISLAITYYAINSVYLIQDPSGLHFIRQTDSLSFILYYFHQNNFNFFDVGNLNLDFEDGKTACEFPIIYYLNFLIFKITGIDFTIVRTLSLACASVSLFFLLRASFMFLKNIFLSVAVVLLVISSTVYRYYSVNYLPDSFAISFTFIGLYYFFKFLEAGSNRTLNILLFFLMLAALMKVYYGIYFIAITLFLIYRLKNSFWRILSRSILFFTFIVAWYVYSIVYNKFYGSNYYLTESAPIWKLTSRQIDQVFDFMSNYWYTKYYLPTVFHAIIVFAVLILIPLRVKLTEFRVFILLLFFGATSYFSLFFRNFRDHDYYFMPLIPFFYFIIVFSSFKLFSLLKSYVYRYLIIVLILLIAVLGFNYTGLNMQRRYTNSIDQFSIVGYQLKDVSHFLNDNAIPPDAKFIVIGDETVNGSLVFLNRFGWIFNKFDNNSENITNKLKLADYLLVLSPSKNKVPEEINKVILQTQVLKFRNNHIYSLKQTKI